jgi:hypothetical protein
MWNKFFFPKDTKERSWKVILWKDPHGRCITKKVQIDPIDLNMFKLESLGEYVGLQAPISIDEYIHPMIILGGSIVNVVDVVVDPIDGEENDGTNNLEEFDSSFNNENKCIGYNN